MVEAVEFDLYELTERIPRSTNVGHRPGIDTVVPEHPVELGKGRPPRERRVLHHSRLDPPLICGGPWPIGVPEFASHPSRRRLGIEHA